MLIRPAQTKRELRPTRLQDLVKRTIQEAFSIEPIVVVAERVNTVFLSHTRLRFAYLGQPKIIEPKVGREMRLIVAPE
jgi:hypothetical protein